jgi:hypothetical protein
MHYKCPVCGYMDLPEPPVNFSICPSCGTEFGYDDASRSYPALREEWVSSGAPWFSRARAAPPDWNAWWQLISAGYAAAVPFGRAGGVPQPYTASSGMVSLTTGCVLTVQPR